MIIDNNTHGRNCSCGQVGCVEAYSSAKSTSIRMFEADVVRERERARMRKSLSADPNKITGKFYLMELVQCVLCLVCCQTYILSPSAA